MNDYSKARTIFLLAALLVCGQVNAQSPLGAGERLAKEAMGLIAFAEIGNIGAADPECEGTPFPVTNIDSLIEAEILPVLESLGRAEGNADPKQIAEMIDLLRKLPVLKENGTVVVKRIYEQMKQEARTAYGAAGVCPAVSSMVQTVMQQRRLGLRDVSAGIVHSKPK